MLRQAQHDKKCHIELVEISFFVTHKIPLVEGTCI